MKHAIGATAIIGGVTIGTGTIGIAIIGDGITGTATTGIGTTGIVATGIIGVGTAGTIPIGIAGTTTGTEPESPANELWAGLGAVCLAPSVPVTGSISPCGGRKALSPRKPPRPAPRLVRAQRMSRQIASLGISARTGFARAMRE